MAVCGVFAPGRGLLGAVQQEAISLFPPRAGVTARGWTVRLDSELRERIEELLAELGWFGLAELQFVVPEAGEPRLIDLNGRFYGSLALAVEAGCNLPAIWAALATGQDGADPVGRPGVRYQWLEGDLRRAAVERRGGLARDVLDCVRWAWGARHSVWRRDDPWPAVRYAMELPARARRRARGQSPQR
jgi:predicted ATP-grasp superfamily ATP-dependent carboligase